MMARRVSIVLTTYNGEHFLPAQLASYLAQSRLPDELVVGDDGSGDGTIALLEDFARRAPFPVRVTVNESNLGPSANFVESVLRSSGDVIFLSDQDDIWHENKIERMMAHLAAHPLCWLVTHDAALVGGDGATLGLTMGGQIEGVAGGVAARDLVAGCCMAFDARLARLYDPAPRLAQHDAWLAAAAGRLGLRAYLPEALIDYRRHGGNVSASFMSDARRASRWARFRDRAGKAMATPVAVALTAAAASREDLVAAFVRHADVLTQVVAPERLAAEIAIQRTALAREKQRLAIHRGPRLARPAKLVAALLGGTYSEKGGAMSLLRDLGGLLR